MNGLFLCGSCGVFLEIAVLGKFDEGLGVFGGSGFVGKGRLKLSVDNNVCVSTDGGGKVGVKRDIESVVTIVFVGIFSGNEIFRSLHRFDE